MDRLELLAELRKVKDENEELTAKNIKQSDLLFKIHEAWDKGYSDEYVKDLINTIFK
jgi:hypothetical protein